MKNMMRISLCGDRYEAFLVIDSVLNETSSGGVRIAHDVTLEEILTLAHEMTFKYSLFRLPRGGAKTGIRLSDQLTASEKDHALREIGRKLGPVIRKGIYCPGMDMNCGPAELRAIYAGAGIRIGQPTDTSFFTALSVENALEACYEESGATGPWKIAIEGFGRVGGHLAERLPADRYRIVALSTLCGAVRNLEGWDGKRLAAERARVGDQVVARVGGESIAIEDLLVEPVDVLLPSTRTWVITRPLVERIQARTIVPVANAPYDGGVTACLLERGILCLPGFVTNAGGVFGSSMYDCGMTEAAVEETIREFYRPMVRQLVRRAKALGVSPVELAEGVASRELAARNGRANSSGPIAKLGRLVARRLPKRFLAAKAKRQFVDSVKSVTRELESAAP